MRLGSCRQIWEVQQYRQPNLDQAYHTRGQVGSDQVGLAKAA
jgi:hypothetical protein